MSGQGEIFGGGRDPSAPLAERMRPRTLAELLGQRAVVGEGKLLRKAIERDEVPSLVLWGPPGCGKTTLATVIAQATRRHFISLSAVLGGVAELRAAVAEAEGRRRSGTRTILFVDEIHRWSRSQQDALLPHVERGTLTLIGATTENPSFALNAALLSRARVFVLEPLAADELAALLGRALTDELRGLGKEALQAEPEALAHLSRASFGDARRALSALEVAAAEARTRPERTITLVDAEAALQKSGLSHDRAGEAHFDLASALIKALRNGDVDASLYYAVRMIEGGEDPRYLCRRLIVFAAEDVGLADPRGLQLALDALRAYEMMGLPEGRIPIALAVSYLAAAPRSNTAYRAWDAAKACVAETGPLPVPMFLRNAATGLLKQLGYGEGYQYPHDEPGRHVPVDCLPAELHGRRFYEPGEQGLEKAIAERVRWTRARVAGGEKP